ncbi:MAG: hypothetical protein P8129_23100, partial [Anaerolineae bacterium]
MFKESTGQFTREKDLGSTMRILLIDDVMCRVPEDGCKVIQYALTNGRVGCRKGDEPAHPLRA